MKLTIEFQQESDRRWIAAVPQLPGLIVYCDTRARAAQLAMAFAFRVLADQIEWGEIDAAALDCVTFAA